MNSLQKNETFPVSYASSDDLSSHSATIRREDRPAMMTKFIHDPFPTYPIPHNEWHSPQKKLYEKVIYSIFQTYLGQILIIPKTIISTIVPYRNLEY